MAPALDSQTPGMPPQSDDSVLLVLLGFRIEKRRPEGSCRYNLLIRSKSAVGFYAWTEL
jgi:hypothetical protein